MKLFSCGYTVGGCGGRDNAHFWHLRIGRFLRATQNKPGNKPGPYQRGDGDYKLYVTLRFWRWETTCAF
jgi:hypothetical protein